MEDGDDDDVGEAERHRDLHEHGRDTQAGALLGVSTEFRESFTLIQFEYNILTEEAKSRNFDDSSAALLLLLPGHHVQRRRRDL